MIFESQKERKSEQITLEITEPDCCIGCGVNECEKPQCPYECCSEDDLFQVLECSDNTVCSGNKCVLPRQAALEEGAILSKEEGVSTIIYTVPTEIKAGEYLEIVILPGNEGYARKITFRNIKGKTEGSYNIRCGKVVYECIVKVRQRYKTSTFWEPGKYYIEVIDIETKKPAKAYFDVIG